MALQAEERDLHRKKIIMGRTMGIMAVPAVVHIVRMLKEVGTIFFAVALHAGILDRRLPEHHFCRRPVSIMTVGAENPLLRHRMVARQ
jgi:hypothetical protein